MQDVPKGGSRKSNWAAPPTLTVTKFRPFLNLLQLSESASSSAMTIATRKTMEQETTISALPSAMD